MKVVAVLLTLVALLCVPHSINQTKEETFVQTPPYTVTTKEILAVLYSVPEPRNTILSAVIDDASIKEGVPTEYLIAIIRVESDFQWDRVSTEGAIGYSQILPKYWKGHEKYNVYDQYENVYLSAYILREYYDKLGDWSMAFKAYNVGITNFKKKRQLDAQTRYMTKINRQLNKIYGYQDEKSVRMAEI